MSDSDPENIPQNEKSAYLNYNVRWMSRTFNTRAKVESLLGPERDAGNISAQDYEAAVKFLPSYHRYYGLVFTTAAISVFYLRRKPSWSQTRTWAVGFGSAFGSLAFGNGLTLKSHFDFVRALDNPTGFSSALDRIQKQSGVPPPPGPIIARKINVELEDPHGNINDYQDSFVTTTVPGPTPEQPDESQLPQQPSGDRPISRWDQIRAANTSSSASSSWDALRQKHEKARIQKPADVNETANQNANETTDNRAAEQAQFDALLERERKLGSQ